jgi:NNP family nitrate/nitrite transporter-like MFS transporter
MALGHRNRIGEKSSMDTQSHQRDTASATTTGRRVLMLTLATIGFAVNFWAWALLSPLGPMFKDSLALAAALGAASGAVFALVARLAPANKVGSVTGVVGAAGGLGGFVPPLLMGALYGALSSYGLGLAALTVVALAALVFTSTTVRHAMRAPTA